MVKKIIKKIGNMVGVDILKYPQADLRRRIKLIDFFNVNKILDIGANEGQYAKLMRELGYRGKIISFEPLSETYKILKANFKNDQNWQGVNVALGDKDEKKIINIAEQTTCSSILDLNEGAGGGFSVKYDKKEEIQVQRLDSIFNLYYNPGDIIFLKIDVQGYEKNILDGMGDCFDKIKGIQIEMSLVQLYNGEDLYLEIIGKLQSKGFELYSIENVCHDYDTGRLLQVDGIFFRN